MTSEVQVGAYTEPELVLRLGRYGGAGEEYFKVHNVIEVTSVGRSWREVSSG